MSLRIRLVRPFGPRVINGPGATFSTEIAAADADALLCEWGVTAELYDFRGPAAWYTGEPRENPRMGVLTHPAQVEAIARARPEQQLYPAQADSRFRVPHVTHQLVDGALPFATYSGERLRKAAALIRNAGGPMENRWPEIHFRNAFATARGVDLFGPEWVWSRKWDGRWYRLRRPASYRGEPEAIYLAQAIGREVTADYWPNNVVKVGLFSRYHAAICLENTLEPFYFTEKFVDGVLAGCVPIYRAHPTVRDGILRGARWVDPADFGLSVERTLAFALSLNRAEVAAQNCAWLESAAVQATESSQVWTQIAAILIERRQHYVQTRS